MIIISNIASPRVCEVHTVKIVINTDRSVSRGGHNARRVIYRSYRTVYGYGRYNVVAVEDSYDTVTTSVSVSMCVCGCGDVCVRVFVLGRDRVN